MENKPRKQGGLKSELTRITLPIFIDVALVMMLGAVDTVMLSNYSDQSVAAVGLDNQLMSLIFLVYQFVSMGAAILCAQYLGAGLHKRVRQVVGIGLALNILLGLIVSAILWLWADPILQLMGLRPELMADGVTYLRITGSLSFFQAISLLFSSSLRSADKTVYPMLATLAVNILNIAGNYALIFGHWGCPRMGVEGAAWATVGSRIIATLILAILMPVMFNKKITLHIKPRSLIRKVRNNFSPFPAKEVRNLLHIGIPAMSEELSYCLSQVVITYFINQISTEALAARTYCFTAITFVFLFCTSITQGGDILVGHLVGRKRYQAAYILGNFMLRRSMAITMTCSVILAALGTPLMHMLTDNQDIIQMGIWIFVIDSFLEVGRVRNIFACGTLRSAGDVIYPVVIGVIFQWSIAVGLAYVLGIPMGLGILGMWIGFALDENLRGIILVHRWHSKKWCGRSFA